MKYLPLALLTLATLGCTHNEFDVSPAQVSQHRNLPKPTSPALPPSGKNFKKGDRLPDGTIAEGNLKLSSDGH